MSRKEGQKRKLLVLLEILARETDEKHPLSVPQLVEKLQEHGVVAERKSVYDDLNTLNNLPDTKYEIVQQRGRGGGYYMTDAPFELAELKLLVDAVYASKFITARKSKIWAVSTVCTVQSPEISTRSESLQTSTSLIISLPHAVLTSS